MGNLAQITSITASLFLSGLFITASAEVTFSLVNEFNAGTFPSAVAIANLNGDNYADLAVVSSSISGEEDTLSVLLGNGAGQYSLVASASIGRAPREILARDLNGDGFVDLAISHSGYSDTPDNRIAIFHGDGTGQMSGPVFITLGDRLRSIVVTDINDDNLPDLLASGFYPSGTWVILNSPTGFSQPTEIDMENISNTSSISVGDFDGDGKADLVLSHNGVHVIRLLRGDGTGGFSTLAQLQSTGVTGAATGDFNGDGQLDIVAVGNVPQPGRIWLGRGDGSFTQGPDFEAAFDPIKILVADLNSDDALDILVITSGSEQLAVSWGDGTGRFSAPSSLMTATDSRIYPRNLAISDLDADGLPDIAVANSHNVGILFNTSPETSPPTTVVAAVLPSSRSIQTGATATAFASIINTGSKNGTQCRISPRTALAGQFLYQQTDASTNALAGSANTPVDIPAGSARSFIMAFTPSATFGPAEVEFDFSCANALPGASTIGLNSLLLSVSDSAVPDIIALAATQCNDGIVNIPNTIGTGVFSIASTNVGASSTIFVSADFGGASIPAAITLCETDPVSGRCINPLVPSVDPVQISIAPQGTPTFGIFVTGNDNVPFDPAGSRVFVRFTDASGVTRGSTSVAVLTAAEGCGNGN